MSEVSVIGLDLANHVFQVDETDEVGRVVILNNLRRAQVLELFGRQPRCMEARGAAEARRRRKALAAVQQSVKPFGFPLLDLPTPDSEALRPASRDRSQW